MASIMHPTVRPVAQDAAGTTRPQQVGLALAVLGLGMAVVTLVANITAGGDPSVRVSTLPWSFGLTTTAFGTLKLGIGVVLYGILLNLWLRVDSIKTTLGRLVRVEHTVIQSGRIRTAHGLIEVGDGVPSDLPIHKMAKKLWSPMLAMGYMAVIVGFFISLSWASGGGVTASAWTQGIQFLGEGFLLSGISFILGTILWAIRTGGGEVQKGLGVAVKTLRMPVTAKLFVALMAAGLMASVVQFVLYLALAGGAAANNAAWFAFLGPLRELSLALILGGITFALVAIGTALTVQFDRVVELLKTGK